IDRGCLPPNLDELNLWRNDFSKLYLNTLHGIKKIYLNFQEYTNTNIKEIINHPNNKIEQSEGEIITLKYPTSSGEYIGKIFLARNIFRVGMFASISLALSLLVEPSIIRSMPELLAIFFPIALIITGASYISYRYLKKKDLSFKSNENPIQDGKKPDIIYNDDISRDVKPRMNDNLDEKPHASFEQPALSHGKLGDPNNQGTCVFCDSLGPQFECEKCGSLVCGECSHVFDQVIGGNEHGYTKRIRLCNTCFEKEKRKELIEFKYLVLACSSMMIIIILGLLLSTFF
ncbi:MAG: hypothetical protein Q6373_014815, partial [Candidatus Sigynarchaeota archaeon]